jgi:hypothetical protein
MPARLTHVLPQGTEQLPPDGFSYIFTRGTSIEFLRRIQILVTANKVENTLL